MQEPTFLIMTALAAGAQHGYGIMTDVMRISDGRVRLRAGTLYAALDRLKADGLVTSDHDEIVDGRLRRYYRITDTGTEQLAAEVRRLIELGAVPIDIGQGDVPWQVLADPEGNEFCVLEPRPVYRDTGPVAAVVVECADPVAVAGFWQLATGWLPASSTTHGVSFRSPHGVGPYLELLPAAGAKVVKHRIHLDVAPYPDEDQSAAVAVLLERGAVPADVGQGDAPWSVLADLQGNEFCVLSPR